MNAVSDTETANCFLQTKSALNLANYNFSSVCIPIKEFGLIENFVLNKSFFYQ